MYDSITCIHENYRFLILINSTQLNEWYPSSKATTKYYLKINHKSNGNSYPFFKLKNLVLNSFLNSFKKTSFKYLQYNIKEYDFPIRSVYNSKIKILFKSPTTHFPSIKVF